MFFLQTITSSLAATTSASTIHFRRTAAWNDSTSLQYAHQSDSLFPAYTPTTPHQVVQILVGAAGQLAFNPNSISVSVGTVLQFNFLGLNHTLTQSQFKNPCQKNGSLNTGFNQFNPMNVSGKFVVDFEVDTDKPQWFYCAQTFRKSHCHAGMVFSVNPGGKADQFIENARNSTIKAAPVLLPTTNAYPFPSKSSEVPLFPTVTNPVVLPSVGKVASTGSSPSLSSTSPEISNGAGDLLLGLSHCLGGVLVALVL